MAEFMRAGGVSMWVVLLLGGATLLTAALFAREPEERRMAMIRSLTWAGLMSMLTAVASNMAAVCYKAPAIAARADTPGLHEVVMQGIGEALSPAILGGAFLTLAWLVASVGMRRLADRLEATA